MSQQNNLKRPLVSCNGVANSSTECSSTPHKRRRQTNQALEALGQLIKNPCVDDVDNRLNKNDILSLTLARLLRHKYWPSHSTNKNTALAAGIVSASITDDLNGFIVVCNTSGRIVLMSDNVEYYLRKNVRSLYPQLTSIYHCVSSDDHESLRNILSRPTYTEQRIICKWNLPRGKRPSRTHTETKTMLMTGHFFLIDNEETHEQSEPLFVARCEQILSSTPNVPTNSVGSISTTTLRLVLTDQLNIGEISSNTESLLGYKSEELIDQSINRFLATEHMNILERARLNCNLSQHHTTMSVMDMYTSNGDRLSFLCNIHMLVEGRRKTTKIGLLAQLIDPSARYEFITYANKQNAERLNISVPQEPARISNRDLNTSVTTNILLPKTEECLDLNNLPSVYPAMVLPQRRKRRRLSPPQIKMEPLNFNDEPQQNFQTIQELNESHISSSHSSPSTASPIQEIGFEDQLFPFFDDMIEFEKLKYINDFPSIDEVNDVLGIGNDQQCFLLTPTMSSLNFFN